MYKLDCEMIKKYCDIIKADIDCGSTDHLTLNAAILITKQIAEWQRQKNCSIIIGE